MDLWVSEFGEFVIEPVARCVVTGAPLAGECQQHVADMSRELESKDALDVDAVPRIARYTLRQSVIC
jgi:hypothetical protein